MEALNNFLFIGLPYAALAVMVVGAIHRYKSAGFKYSSLSAQFLESGRGFWGTVPFHWGIIVIFFGHLTAFLFPRTTLLWNSHPVRLIILEFAAFTLGLTVLVALASLFFRRLTHPRIRMVTNKMDILIEIVLLIQVILGLWIALGYRWGSSWFASDLSPYLWSLVTLSPDISVVVVMPAVIKMHIIFAFIILLLIPFTRLVHFLVAPFHYIWRPYQQVMWYWDRKQLRDTKSSWSEHPPTNN